MLERLNTPLPSGFTLALLACLVSGAAGAGIAFGFGYRYADAQGSARLERLERRFTEQAKQAAEENLLRYQQQVTRANEAETLLLAAQDRVAGSAKQIEERIPHVTTNYRPAPAAAPVAIPHCVFTAGWLRDYNLALGVPAPGTGTVAAHGAQTTWPAPGTDAELLESGVTPADILAHAKDYGVWASALHTQLNALLDLQEKD
ncbi:lysis protein [Pseudomonas anguilliseptica]|uniref:Lysis protein n=1 Tax=Pseudomonas anguilliseptica TaxID=53406 RepID=A0A1H5B4Q2_PSEAG|nr:lysis protein [Pseudomonas anguilliseptica]SED49357.1 hypothetical protein SAMN05421553_2760 [Pseudomonas anguilliseptica]